MFKITTSIYRNAENKIIDVDDEKFSVSSLLWRDLYPQVGFKF